MHTITIPGKEIPEQNFVMFDPEKDIEEIIKDNLGHDMSSVFHELIWNLKSVEPEGDDYERIADGYRQMLVDTMNELQEIVYAKRLDRKRLERLYKELDNNL